MSATSVAGERAGVLVRVAEASIVQKLLAPDVGADEREFRPVDADARAELALQRSQRALARRRRALGVHHDRMGLPRETTKAFGTGRLVEHRRERRADRIARGFVAREAGRKARDHLARPPRLAVPVQERGDDARERAAGRAVERVAVGVCSRMPLGDDRGIPFRRSGRGRRRRETRG